MNSKALFVLLLTISGISSAQFQEITSERGDPVISEYVILSKSLYRLYTPRRAAVINSLSVGSTTTGDVGFPAITIQLNNIKLGGGYILLLEPFLISKNTKKINSNVLFNQTNESAAFIPIDDYADVSTIKMKSQSGSGIVYKGWKLWSDNTTLPGRYSSLGVSKADFEKSYKTAYCYGTELLNIWANFLKTESMSTDQPVFVMAPNGDVYPAIIKVYGQIKTMYAMYGVWTDQEKAQKYGYNAGERVYMSAEKILPDEASCPTANELMIEKGQRYGLRCYKYEEIMADKQGIFPDLAWAAKPLHSDMTGKTYDATGTAFYQGLEVPNSPDNTNNMNGMSIEDCPDRDWYWGLFCRCATEKTQVTERKTLPSKYVDYRDYMNTEMQKQQYDPTIYGNDESITPLKANTDNQPVDPFLFNKECVLLNARVPRIFDPFADNAGFSIYRRYWENDWLNTGWKVGDVDITSRMRQCLKDMESVYGYFCKEGAKESDWEYYKSGNTWYKRWQYPGDVEFSLTNEEYKDSAWYIANPYANYGQYEDFKSFAVYDNFTATGCGPFKLIACDVDNRDESRTNVPDYQRYSKSFWDGSISSTAYYNKKDWYVQWNYYVLAKDQWGRKVTVGTLKFTSTLWKGEDNGVMHPNYDMFDQAYNRFVVVSGTSLMSDQIAKYDKNSQDYRTDQADVNERNPEEFDKSEAMAEIARKILVAEAFDYVMKTMHYIATHQKNQTGVAAGALYETSKRVENRIAQSVAYKLAKQTYEGYVLWKRTMDVMKNLRDTYVRIGSAWDGLLYGANSIIDYYKNLDLTKIQLTNITDLFPKSSFYELDYRVFALQKSTANFAAAVHAFALESDSLTHGNYGPLNPVIRVGYASLTSSIRQSGENSSVLLQKANGETERLKSATKATSSDQQYLSNVSHSVYNIIANNRVKVMNNGTRNIALAMYLTEADAKSWVNYSRYVQKVAVQAPKDIKNVSSKYDKDSWFELGYTLHNEDIFEEPMSGYLKKLSESK